MPLPWEEGGETDDWSEVRPQHLEFSMGVDGMRLYVTFGQAGSGYDWDEEIPQEWVEQYLPGTLREQVMESTFVVDVPAGSIAGSQVEADLLRRGFRRRASSLNIDQRNAESIRAAEDAQVFAALDNIALESAIEQLMWEWTATQPTRSSTALPITSVRARLIERGLWPRDDEARDEELAGILGRLVSGGVLTGNPYRGYQLRQQPAAKSEPEKPIKRLSAWDRLKREPDF